MPLFSLQALFKSLNVNWPLSQPQRQLCLIIDKVELCKHPVWACVPASRADERERNELVPERIILRYGLCADQGLETGVSGQIADLACVGTHLHLLPSVGPT